MHDIFLCNPAFIFYFEKLREARSFVRKRRILFPDKIGYTAIFFAWKCEQKEYESIRNGPHGKSTVLLANDAINNWINEQQK